jgi:hypothetical protein
MAGAISTSYFGTDLHHIINDLYVAVTGLATSAVSAVATDLQTASDLDVGGDVLRLTKSLVVCASAVSTVTIGNLCTLEGKEFMVAQFSTSTDGLALTLDLADPTT